MKKISIFFFLVILLIVFAEPFGDSIFMNSFGLVFQNKIELFDNFLKQVIISLFLLYILTTTSKAYLSKKFHIPSLLILIVFTYALFWGIIKNEPVNSINEFSSIFPIFLIFVLPKYPELISISSLERYIRFLVKIVFVKFILYQLFFITQFGYFSWKVLMKQSVILLLPFSYYLNKWNQKTEYKTGVMIVITLFLIVIAQARTLLIAAFFIYIIVFFQNLNKHFLKQVSINISIIGFMILSYFSYLYSQNVNLIDSVEYLFSGNEANESVNFRIEQYLEIKNRILSSPILGKGFGYFNPNYSTYSELSKPYLLEMDMLNFISKIGLPAFLIYMFSYILLYFFITKINDNSIRKLFMLYFWCLISFILYSFGQTLHQSYIYWFSYAVISSSLISTLQNQKKYSYNV